MKINSNFVDFYDYAINYYNDIPYYNRKTFEDDNIKNYSYKTCSIFKINSIKKFNDEEYLFNFFILNICNKYFYPYIQVIHLNTNKNYYFFSTQNFISFLISIYSEKKLLKNNFHLNWYSKYLNDFFNQKYSLFSNFPITTYKLENNNIIKPIYNISLSNIDFHNQINLSIIELYQEIELFLNYQLNHQKDIVFNDKIIRNSKGFDKNSFIKRKEIL